MEDMKSDNNDQENELKELLNEVNNHNEKDNNQRLDTQDHQLLEEEISEIYSDDQTMNVLNLPPRKEVHGQKKNRTHIKIKRPFIRLAIVVILLLAVITLLLFYSEGLLNL